MVLMLFLKIYELKAKSLIVLLLASASQRRTELLDLMGVEHKVIPQDFDEDSVTEKIQQFVQN